jgi:outer membrane lipoprotein-sorting protein
MMTQKFRTFRQVRRSALLALGALALTVAAPDDGHAAKDAALEPAQKAVVQKVGDYFNKVTNLQGEFIQVGPRGHVSQGVFYLSKPGKLRFEYSAPNPFLIVSDGTWVIVNNRKRNKAEYYPLSATPLRLVLDEKVDLLDQAKIIHVKEDKESVSVTLEDKDQLVAGQLTVVFDARSMELRQWVVIDGQGLQTTITLQGLKDDVAADPKLFEVKLRNEIKINER